MKRLAMAAAAAVISATGAFADSHSPKPFVAIEDIIDPLLEGSIYDLTEPELATLKEQLTEKYSQELEQHLADYESCITQGGAVDIFKTRQNLKDSLIFDGLLFMKGFVEDPHDRIPIGSANLVHCENQRTARDGLDKGDYFFAKCGPEGKQVIAFKRIPEGLPFKVNAFKAAPTCANV